MLLRPRRSYVGLGSNLGDRAANLSRAVELLGVFDLRVVSESSIYRTDPVDVVDQGEFLNQVIAWDSPLPVDAQLATCLEVEGAMGRVRTRERGPRVIDLDLLLCGDEVRNAPGVVVPHPRMHLRRFVLVPLAEIAPEVRHPVLGLTAAELLARCVDRSRVERVEP